MRLFCWLALFGVLTFLSSCNRKTEIAGFNSQAWKADAGSCKNVRNGMLAEFEKAKPELFGLAEKEVKAILGRPDGEELFERNQRYFYYYIESGSHCQTKGKMSGANHIKIRFSALSKVNEITYAHPIEN